MKKVTKKLALNRLKIRELQSELVNVQGGGIAVEPCSGRLSGCGSVSGGALQGASGGCNTTDALAVNVNINVIKI